MQYSGKEPVERSMDMKTMNMQEVRAAAETAL